MDPLVSWFESQGGTFDKSALVFTDIPDHGRGAIALRDLPEGHTLFSIPRDVTLSSRTSTLPSLLGTSHWRNFGLAEGWAGIMLCMMWEEAQGTSSKWSCYLASLPTSFDTPMFWNEADLEELEGTAVVEKIGKEQAEKDYREKVVPALQSRLDLFVPEQIPKYYSLENYHLMGSRVLSRSFHVEKWESEESAEGHDHDTAMDIDEEKAPVPSTAAEAGPPEVEEADGSSDDDESDGEDPADVAMVPMADMLNAKYGCENAKLFYEERELLMTTTKPISKGEQIWNTYGDPPNSDLLRRYGHVDLVPLHDGGLGNPADVVEVRADLAVSAAAKISHGSSDSYAERVDWWLEEGGDDVFIIETNHRLPDELISFIRLLLLPSAEWDKVKVKSKLPKPKGDDHILPVAAEVLQSRLAEYKTTIEDDEQILSARDTRHNLRNATVVRLGEKKILQGTLNSVKDRLKSTSTSKTKEGKKRKAED
ncbi:SET domain-containing protein, partial [Dentipellis sp. KUC8613]